MRDELSPTNLTQPYEEHWPFNCGEVHTGEKTMSSLDDFRMESHKLLMELDAATIGIMMLVSGRRVSGPEWDVATNRQHDAYARWDAFMNSPSGAALNLALLYNGS